MQTSDRYVNQFVDLERLKKSLAAPNPTAITKNKFSVLFNNNEEPQSFIHPDTGAKKSCVTKRRSLVNDIATPIGMKIGSCSNHVLESKSKGKLPITKLPDKAKTAYKFEDMSLNLLSIGSVCDAGCVSVFKKSEMYVAKEDDIDITLRKEPIITGTRNGENDLWQIPLPPAEIKQQEEDTLFELNNLALSAYKQTNAKDLAKYLHACAGYPVIETWIKAIRNGYYASWPKLNRFTGPTWIAKHLQKSIITTMGHMKAARQGTRSTTKKKDKEVKEEKEEEELPLEPPRPHLERDKNHQVICVVIPAKELKGLVCMDLSTWKVPYRIRVKK